MKMAEDTSAMELMDKLKNLRIQLCLTTERLRLGICSLMRLSNSQADTELMEFILIMDKHGHKSWSQMSMS